MQDSVPTLRIRRVNEAPLRGDRSLVVYWMTSARRVTFNFALQRAADLARHLGLPLVVLEALRAAYPWASARFHRFVLDGMADTARRLAERDVLYYPYVEPRHGAGGGLLGTLAGDAAIVVADDYPTFFLPRMIQAAGQRLDVRLEAVDGNGLLPMAAADRDYPTAYSFRRFLQKNLRDHLRDIPLADPLLDPLPPPAQLPQALFNSWPAADRELLEGSAAALARLPIDADVAPVPTRGGTTAGEATLSAFLASRLEAYGERRNRPEELATSGLSPYLHFGHLSAHQVVLELLLRERWSEEILAKTATGQRSGWWGLSEPAEAFLDQVVTWRELGFNVCRHRSDHDRWESLPEWARNTLGAHAADPREHLYDRRQFEQAATHDPLWNAAQTQLVREGTIHNYLRMLWGKKILEWSSEPREALEIMIELNNRWALDGRDPNSYSGIFWVLGRHDRPWAPERPVLGRVRYMSSTNTARKLPVKGYLEKFEPGRSRSA